MRGKLPTRSHDVSLTAGRRCVTPVANRSPWLASQAESSAGGSGAYWWARPSRIIQSRKQLCWLFAVEGVVRSARRWPGRGRGLPRMEVTMISGSKCSGSGWSPIGRFSGAGLSSPSDGVVAADARARPGTRWSGGWRTSRSGGGPRCWRSASADTGVTPPPTTGTRTDDAPRAVSRRRCRRSSRAGCPRGPRAGRSPGSRAGTPTATSAPCPAVRSRGCAGRRSRGSGRTPPGRRR